MSGRSVLGLIAGTIVGAAVFFLAAPAAWATLAAGVAFSATALAFAGGSFKTPSISAPSASSPRSPTTAKSSTVQDAAAQQIQISSSSESVTVPVPFGKVKLSGNYLRYDLSTFRNEPIIQTYQVSDPVVQENITVQQTPSGGGGGGKGGLFSHGSHDQPAKPKTSGSKTQEAKTHTEEQVVGYKYFLSWDYGLCVGPLESVGIIQSNPGETVVGAGAAFGADSQVLSIEGNEQGGTVRVFRGSAAQARVGFEPYGNDDSNYRGVAFASFIDFYMGNSPQPKTYTFEVTRMPECFGADGITPVPGMKVRGSADPAHPCFNDANPAAILYEVFTNKQWGRGLDPALLDIASFVSASQFFETQNIGVSFVLDAQNIITDAIDSVRLHVNTVVVWNGDKLRCRCMMDRTTAYTPKITITSEQVTDVLFTRPAWPATINEIRAEFTNRSNNYQAEIALAQDLANINTVGIINSKKMAFHGFNDRATAETQLGRILQDFAFPSATLQFKMNRFETRLEPGDFVEFVWGEWSAGPITTFWRVAEINDDSQAADGVEVTLAEDIYATSYEGEGAAFTPPIPPFEQDVPNQSGDIFLGNDATLPLEIGDLAPVKLWEMNPFLSSGDPDFIVTTERGAGAVNAVVCYWSPLGTSDYVLHSVRYPWALTGALLTALPDRGRSICRQSVDAFRFSLNNPDDEAALLSAANKVMLDSDNIMVLPGGGTDLFLVGNEILQLGKVVEVSPGVYEATNYLRACFGSAAESHSIGAATAFLQRWSRNNYASGLNGIPLATPFDFRCHALTVQGENATNFDTTGPEVDGSLLGRGACPFAPSYLSHTKVSDAWTLTLRPRWIDVGAMVEPDIQADVVDLVASIPEGSTFHVEPYISGSPAGAKAIVPVVFTPDDGSTKAAGKIVISYNAPAGTDMLKVYAGRAGKVSLAPLVIPA